MASTYTTNTGIEKPGTGDQSGTWGTTTNTNFDIIDRGMNGLSTVDLTALATYTLNTAGGSLSDGQAKVIRLTEVSPATPQAGCKVVITPNTAQKLYFIQNTTSEAIEFYQGTYSSSNSAIVQAGKNAIIFSDGIGVNSVVREIQTDLLDDSTPQLGGNLDLNGKDITGTGNISITGTIIGTGTSTVNGITSTGNIDAGANTIQTTGSVEARTVDLGDWTITEDQTGASPILKIAYTTGGTTTNMFSLDTTGNLIIKGNVTAFGTP